MPIRDALLPEFEQEIATTRRVLERCPEDKYTWKPHEKSFSLGDLAAHVTNMAGWLAGTLASDNWDISPNGEEYKEDRPKTRAEMLALFDKNVEAARKALAQATDEQFGVQWSLLSAGKPIFTMPRIAVVRGMIFNHLIHHRGQLSVYLRLLNVAVPSIYGPSADEQPAQAQSA